MFNNLDLQLFEDISSPSKEEIIKKLSAIDIYYNNVNRLNQEYQKILQDLLKVIFAEENKPVTNQNKDFFKESDSPETQSICPFPADF